MTAAGHAAAIREALLDSSNSLVPGTMSEKAHDALDDLDALEAEVARLTHDNETLLAAIEEERKWATGTQVHRDARSAMYKLAKALASADPGAGEPT